MMSERRAFPCLSAMPLISSVLKNYKCSYFYFYVLFTIDLFLIEVTNELHSVDKRPLKFLAIFSFAEILQM